MSVGLPGLANEGGSEAEAAFGPFVVRIEAGQLRLLAKAIGEQRPIYTSPKAAQEAGLPGLLGPPTLPFCIGMADDVLFQFLSHVGLDASRALHAGQQFHYYRPICAGDELTTTLRSLGATSKKGGALTFVDIEGTFRDANTGVLVCKQIITLVLVPA